MSCPDKIQDHCQVPFTATFASTLTVLSATLVVFHGRGLVGTKKVIQMRRGSLTLYCSWTLPPRQARNQVGIGSCLAQHNQPVMVALGTMELPVLSVQLGSIGSSAGQVLSNLAKTHLLVLWLRHSTPTVPPPGGTARTSP